MSLSELPSVVAGQRCFGGSHHWFGIVFFSRSCAHTTSPTTIDDLASPYAIVSPSDMILVDTADTVHGSQAETDLASSKRSGHRLFHRHHRHRHHQHQSPDEAAADVAAADKSIDADRNQQVKQREQAHARLSVVMHSEAQSNTEADAETGAGEDAESTELTQFPVCGAKKGRDCRTQRRVSNRLRTWRCGNAKPCRQV